MWLLGALLLLVVGGSVAFGPVVRARVAREAAARHLVVGVGSVRPALLGAVLRDVRVRAEGVQGVELILAEVRVDLATSLSVREITLEGGDLVLEGAPEELEQRLTRWRASLPHTASEPGAGRTKPSLRGRGLAVRWTAPRLSLRVEGVSFATDGSHSEILAESIEGIGGDLVLGSTHASLELDADNHLRSALALSTKLAYGNEVSGSLPVEPQEPAEPLVPSPHENGKSSKDPPAHFVPWVPFPRLDQLRGRIGALAAVWGEKLPDGSEVRIAGLALELRGTPPITLGPGPFSVIRRGGQIALSFASPRGDASPPLRLDLLVPLAPGDVIVTLDGGPVPLAHLGLREGTVGLVDVGKATALGKGRFVLDATGQSLSFDAEARLANLSLKQPRLAHDALHGIDLALVGRGLLTNGTLRLDDGQASLGALRVGLRGTVEQDPNHLASSLAFDVPTKPCQDMLGSLPPALLPSVRGAKLAGTFGGHGRIAFDTTNLDALVLDYEFDHRCRLVEVPAPLSRERFTRPFKHRVYHPDGTPGEMTAGPGSGNWTELGGISPFMQVAVLTTEDGTFLRHHGFNHGAIKSSLIANLKARRFVRGASTITMQLAKNLFLAREKTLSRKLEEIILADYLEQVFRKDDMMELYFNVVEFGPDLYGITRASEHYFGRDPLELNLAECLFLASVLPSPLRHHRFAAAGELPEHWLQHLRSLMRIAAKSHRISPAELEQGLKDPVVFYKPGSPRPPPRPVRRGALEGDESTYPTPPE